MNLILPDGTSAFIVQNLDPDFFSFAVKKANTGSISLWMREPLTIHIIQGW